jgi:hypothetical protein
MSWFEDALSWTAEAADELLGYDTYTDYGMSPTEYTDVFGEAYGPVSSFLDDAIDVYDTIQPYASKAFGAYNALTGERKDAGLFGAPQYDKVSRQAPQTFSAGNFSAGKTGAQKLALEDTRVRDAWSRISQSANPSIRGSMDFVRPTISSRGPTIKLKSASKAVS